MERLSCRCLCNDDDYDGECLNREYKYRVDDVIRYDPKEGRYHRNTMIQGADYQDRSRRYHYLLPDINYENRTYNFNISRYVIFPLVNDWDEERVDFFPLFDLTNKPGPWRFVLSENDRDYKDFTHRRESEWGEDIWTYDMSTEME